VLNMHCFSQPCIMDKAVQCRGHRSIAAKHRVREPVGLSDQA